MESDASESDVYFALTDLLAVSQCCTTSWKAVGGMLAAISTQKGSVQIGFGNEGTYVLQEWDDRTFVNNDDRVMANGIFQDDYYTG